jgi:DnaJ-domain-containing protein 1
MNKPIKKKRSLFDGYKTYDPSVEGYGNAEQWKQAFNQRMSIDDATKIIGKNDPFSLLGLTLKATAEEAKKAFRKLAMQYHPDKNQNDLETATKKMQELLAAYTIVKKRLE